MLCQQVVGGMNKIRLMAVDREFVCRKSFPVFVVSVLEVCSDNCFLEVPGTKKT